MGLSRRQAGAYLNIDPTTITHAAARDEEFAREIERAEELVQVPAMMSLVAASRKNWRAAQALLNRKQGSSILNAEEKHQERLEAVQRKSEVTRLQNLLEHEEVLEKVARNKAFTPLTRKRSKRGWPGFGRRTRSCLEEETYLTIAPSTCTIELVQDASSLGADLPCNSTFPRTTACRFIGRSSTR